MRRCRRSYPELTDEIFITAPMIGIFYASPTPGTPPFVSEGDVVELGQTIGVIEAMKIMNEIAADRSGLVDAVLVASGQPVEYGSPLFRLDAATRTSSVTTRVLPVGVFVSVFRDALEADPFYADLWLEGEVTDLSRSGAGHTYFSLRDADGCLKCVLFRGQALRSFHQPELGEQAAVHGGLSLYPRTGSVQLVADMVLPAGLGAASLELEYLRQRLAAEGLFDPLRKRPCRHGPAIDRRRDVRPWRRLE